MEKEKNIIKNIIPFLCSIAAILFLFGTDIIYKIKIDDTKEIFNLNLINLFDASISPAWLTITVLVLIIIAGVLPLFYFINKLRNTDSIAVTSTFIFLISACLILVYKEVFSYTGASKIENFYSADIGYGFACSLLFLGLGAFSSLLSSPKKYGENVKAITENGVLIALSFVLNFVKIPIGPSGGSINFQMLPLFIIALRRGPIQAFISGGIVFGAISCLSDGYGFATFPFDYLIGFGSVAILGLFRKLVLKEDQNFFLRELFLFVGGFLSTLVRFIGSTLSSIIIYDYPFVAALQYNAIYIPLSGLISIVVLMLLLKPFLLINKRYPAN